METAPTELKPLNFHKREPKKANGRPTKLTAEVAETICSGIANGKSLITIAKELKIDYGAINKWLYNQNNIEFITNYTLARKIQADHHADTIQEITESNKLPPDEKRARIDAYKWLAGKKSNKYSDKPDTSINIGVNVSQAYNEVKALDMDQLKAIRDILKSQE